MAVLHSLNSPVENMNLLLGQLMAISIPFVLGCVFRIRFKNNSMFLYNGLVMVELLVVLCQRSTNSIGVCEGRP